MKKDVFMVWLKEFCSLIFTQTVQAFLLAIIMSVVVATASNGTVQEQGTAVSATGIIAIIALASLSKVELLVKKIFGVESQFGDPAMKNGAGALAGSLIAAKLAGRALNNVPKMASGIKGVTVDARRARASALAKKNRDLSAAMGKDAGNAAGNGALVGAAAGSAAASTANSATGTSAASSSDGTLKGALESLKTAIIENTNATRTASPQIAEAGKASKLTAEKFNKIQDDYDKAMADIAKSKRESWSKLASGALETASLPLGAIGGAAVGAAMGESPLKAAGVGIGATDYLSEKLVGGASAAANFASDIKSASKAMQSAVDAINKTSRTIDGPNAKKVDSYHDAKVRDQQITVRIKQDIDAGKI